MILDDSETIKEGKNQLFVCGPKTCIAVAGSILFTLIGAEMGAPLALLFLLKSKSTFWPLPLVLMLQVPMRFLFTITVYAMTSNPRSIMLMSELYLAKLVEEKLQQAPHRPLTA